MWACPHCISKEYQGCPVEGCEKNTCVFSTYRSTNLYDFALHMYTEHGEDVPKDFPLPPGAKRGKISNKTKSRRKKRKRGKK